MKNLHATDSTWLVGIDLAWGDKKKDGLCLMHANLDNSRIIETTETMGDAALVDWLETHIPAGDCALLSIDAPLIAPNVSGSRPVDREISSEFMKFHAACHSANATKCSRPLRIASLLRECGYIVHHDLKLAGRIALEVYPHPGMVRLFSLQRIFKYKKGPVEFRRLEFKILQEHFRAALNAIFPEVKIPAQVDRLLCEARSKSVEDQTDALFCALIGYLHWKHQGRLSRIVGSVETGFILLPPKFKEGFFRWEKSDRPVVTMELVNKLRDEDDA